MKERSAVFINNINVRIDDLNYGNHLCHAKMVNILHNTRALFLKKNGLSEINCFGFGLIALNLNIDYLSESYFDDLLEIKIYLKSFDKVRLEFSYLVFNQTTTKVAAKAIITMGFFDKEKSKLRRIPEEFKRWIESIDVGPLPNPLPL